jgi:hypothetical protein
MRMADLAYSLFFCSRRTSKRRLVVARNRVIKMANPCARVRATVNARFALTSARRPQSADRRKLNFTQQRKAISTRGRVGFFAVSNSLDGCNSPRSNAGEAYQILSTIFRICGKVSSLAARSRALFPSFRSAARKVKFRLRAVAPFDHYRCQWKQHRYRHVRCRRDKDRSRCSLKEE